MHCTDSTSASRRVILRPYVSADTFKRRVMPRREGRARHAPGFTVNDVRIISRDNTSLAATVFAPHDDDDAVADAPSSSGRHAFQGHAIVMVHAHPKFGGTPEMMHGTAVWLVDGGWPDPPRDVQRKPLPSLSLSSVISPFVSSRETARTCVLLA